jgi:hypothetical protein
MDIKKIRAAKDAMERLKLTEMMIKNITGEKGGGMNCYVGKGSAPSDLTGDVVIRLDELAKRKAKEEEEVRTLCNSAMKELDRLDDPITKQIIILREWEGMRWAWVARKIGYAHSESSVRQRYCRAIKDPS